MKEYFQKREAAIRYYREQEKDINKESWTVGYPGVHNPKQNYGVMNGRYVPVNKAGLP